MTRNPATVESHSKVKKFMDGSLFSPLQSMSLDVIELHLLFLPAFIYIYIYDFVERESSRVSLVGGSKGKVWVCKRFTELQPKLNLLKSGTVLAAHRVAMQFGTDEDLRRLDEGDGRKRSNLLISFKDLKQNVVVLEPNKENNESGDQNMNTHKAIRPYNRNLTILLVLLNPKRIVSLNSSEAEEISSTEDEWLQRLPDKKNPLYSHSLPCIEAWLKDLGFYLSKEDRAIWFIEKPDWHRKSPSQPCWGRAPKGKYDVVWVCKRFTELQPKLNLLKSGGLARWDKSKQKVENVSLVLDSIGRREFHLVHPEAIYSSGKLGFPEV
uniref:Uncharacterized protein n=1 Tax=Salix viminalis TaxID=40686 RepID=A0A6N2KWE1_SALVM